MAGAGPFRDPARVRFASATSASPLTTGTIFTYTGDIEILRIYGVVTTVIQAQATTVKLSITADALASFDICATKDVNGFTAGSVLEITGTAANNMVATTSVGVTAPTLQARSVDATSIVSGIIVVTYGAASTGAIRWGLVWRPLSSGATVT